MQPFIAAAISTQNHIGDPDQALMDMERWLERLVGQEVELALFPELNLSGYITAPVVSQIAEPVPGPSTEKVICLAERYRMTIAFGLIEKDRDRLYCTHVLVNSGGMLGKQRKIHVPAQEQPFWSLGNAI